MVDLVGVFAQIDTILLLVTFILVFVLLVMIYRSPVMALIPVLGVGLVLQLSGAIGGCFVR